MEPLVNTGNFFSFFPFTCSFFLFFSFYFSASFIFVSIFVFLEQRRKNTFSLRTLFTMFLVANVRRKKAEENKGKEANNDKKKTF